MIKSKSRSKRRTLYVTTRQEWREWLAKHHAAETEVWLVYYKKQSGRPRIVYEDAVQEALCFGWIDSLVKRLDDQRFAQKFTPRRDCTKWSASNKRRMRKLIAEGRVTEIGLAKIDPAILEEEPQVRAKQKKKEPALPGFVRQALLARPRAWENFQNLAPSYRRLYLGWIMSAKKDQTRQRRLVEAVSLLAQNKKLGLK